jgi:hydroxymethylpyrimidine/phosphomethylpyrimidine kinase
LTPNLQELEFLTGTRIASLGEAAAVGQALADKLATAVLVKGGHLATTGDESIDLLCQASRVDQLRGPRVRDGEHVHGTGCALSSAIATHLALGADLVEACRAAKAFVAARIAAPARPGRGAPAIV